MLPAVNREAGWRVFKPRWRMKKRLAAMAGLYLTIALPGGISAAPVSACSESPVIREQPPGDPHADAFGYGPWHISADRKIWVGTKFQAGEAGNKVIWIRPAGTKLLIKGRRVDAAGAPLRVGIPAEYPWSFQVTGLYFPSAGCWEVTARAGQSELSFMTEVSPGRR